ncbi:MAG: hypothetical protein V4529_02530 [Gemmatimonadota bacterium]
MEPYRPAHSESVVEAARRIHAARAAEVAPYTALYPLLLGEVGEIMADWDLSTQELPWFALEKAERQNNLASVITRVIDCAMSDATRATVLGYHRAEMEANGLWSTHLEELAKTVRS